LKKHLNFIRAPNQPECIGFTVILIGRVLLIK